MLNWDDMRFLLEVSRRPKLTEAAARLKQDASTVSRRLKRLEQELGLTLFERTRRGHILTPQGQEIAHQAEIAEQTFSSVANLADADSGHVAGRVRLGVTEGLGATVIAPTIRTFTQRHPNVSLDLISMSGFANVSRREADMAIMLTRPTAGRLKVRKLTDYTLRLYSTQAYLSERPTIRRAADLHDHVLIGYMDEMLYSDQLRYHDEISAGLAPYLTSPSIVAQLEMTRAGVGVCMLPQFMARRHADLVPVLHEDIELTRSFWLVIHEDVAALLRIRALADFLLALAPKIAADDVVA